MVFIVDAPSMATSQLITALNDHHFKSKSFSDSGVALESIITDPPMVILSEFTGEGINGEELFQRVRANPATREMPFIFTSRQTDLDLRLKLLDMEIDDYIAKPYYPEEVVARVEAILRESAVSFESEAVLAQGFTGSLEEMSLMDLMQTLELGKKSALIHLVQEPEEGYVFVDKGQVVDAVLRDHPAEEALYNLMLWMHGYFELTMQPVSRDPQIHKSNRELLLTGSQRLHDFKTRIANLPSMDSYVARAAEILQPKLSERESRIWTILERPQPMRLLLSLLQEDELVTIEAVQALWERKYIKIYPGTASDADLIARDIMMHISRPGASDPYSRIASYFLRNGHQKKKAT